MSEPAIENSTHQPNKLPDGYEVCDSSGIGAWEVIDLRLSVGWQSDTEERWDKCLAESLAVVGIRSDAGELVGIGFMAGNNRHAVLCDLVVKPDHQNKGLGSTILDERLRIADELGVKYLYTDVAPTNTLRYRYDDLGFVATGGGLFRDSANSK
jgi:GNAT superfamily N-acetyltransferase